MTHSTTKMVLGLAVSMIFLFGALAAPVAALQTNIKITSENKGFRSGDNNHTYVYVEPNPLDLVSRSTMHLNEDLDYRVYRYDTTGWESTPASLSDGTNPPFNWMSFLGFSTGPFDNPTVLPEFFDFEASDGSEHAVNTTFETRSFGLSFGQHTAVPVDAGYVYFGTLRISGQEFVHLTVDSRQDAVTWNVAVIDPEGRFITSYGGSEGNIWTLPFKPSISGTYYVILQAFPSVGTFALFDLMPVAVSPKTIASENIVTGDLTTGELVITGDSDSWMHEEMAPTTHTYKVNTRDDAASLIYAFNYPENFILTTAQPVSIIFTSNEFVYGYDGGMRYSESYGSPGLGEYYFRGGPYYITVIGGDNTGYTLYHRASNLGALPVNEKFQFENYIGDTFTHAYTLDIAEPSALRVNSTATGAELSISMTGIFEDGFRNTRTIDFAGSIQGAQDYLLPAGEYLVELAIDNGVNEWVKFNINPLTSESTSEFMYVGGFQVDSEVFHSYNISLYLNCEDNVTIDFEVTIYDTSGEDIDTSTVTLANWWDGSSLMPHPSIANNWTDMVPHIAYYDGPVYVTLCAYDVSNNTQGFETNDYMNYPVDVTIEWVSNMVSNQYDRIAPVMDVSESVDAHNFTLALPGIPLTLLWVPLNTTTGTWYNVTVRSADADTITATLFSNYEGRTHRVFWGDLSQEYSGSEEDFTFQFGAISDESGIALYMDRDLLEDGFLWIRIRPMDRNQLTVTEITPLGPDILGMLGGVAIPAVVGVGVIAVVIIVYVKKVKK